MDLLFALVLICINNAPEINYKSKLTGCVSQAVECAATPSRGGKVCAKIISDYYKKES